MLSSCSGISLFVVFVYLFAGMRLVDATSVVVDDANTARVTYSTGWKGFNDCACLVEPTKASAYNGTFHPMTADGSTNAFFTFTFTGTSVEVRYIAVDIIRTGLATNTNVSYSIDGVPRGTAVRNAENRDSYVYDQSLFNVTGLTNGEHTLWVGLSPSSVLLLDYLVYEGESANTTRIARDINNANVSNNNNNNNVNNNNNNNNVNTNTNTISNTSSNDKSPPVGAIVGGVVGGIVGLIIIVVVLWCIFKPKKGHPIKQEDDGGQHRRSGNNPSPEDRRSSGNPGPSRPGPPPPYVDPADFSGVDGAIKES